MEVSARTTYARNTHFGHFLRKRGMPRVKIFGKCFRLAINSPAMSCQNVRQLGKDATSAIRATLGCNGFSRRSGSRSDWLFEPSCPGEVYAMNPVSQNLAFLRLDNPDKGEKDQMKSSISSPSSYRLDLAFIPICVCSFRHYEPQSLMRNNEGGLERCRRHGGSCYASLLCNGAEHHRC